MSSIIPFVNRLWIVDKNTAQPVQLGKVMVEPQLHFLHAVDEDLKNRRPIRKNVLKARQMGFSTLIGAIDFTFAMVLSNYRALVLSKDNDSSEHLLSMRQFYWDTSTLKYLSIYTQKWASANRMKWVENNSAMHVATAKNSSAGRSRTLRFVHASEVAFYDDPYTLMASLSSTIPNAPFTAVFEESTANGIGGYYYDQYWAAKRNESEFDAYFYPWFAMPSYSFPHLPHLNDWELSDEEKVLRKLGIDNGQLQWRRYIIRNECRGSIELFHQEYPSSDTEAFLTSGTNVFPLEHLDKCYERLPGVRGRLIQAPGDTVRFIADPTGPLKIYKQPSNDDFGVYFVCGDPTRATDGDYAAIQVLNARTWEQIAVWRQRIDPVTFGDEIVKLGRFFNNCMVNTEIEGGGYATIARIMSLGYPKVWQHQWADKEPGKLGTSYGWSTTHKRKNEAIAHLLHATVEHHLRIHDEETYMEMKNYVALGNGIFGNGNGQPNDDLVMALAIGLTSIVYELPSIAPYVAEASTPQNGRYAVETETGEVLSMPDEEWEAPWEQWQSENAYEGNY